MDASALAIIGTIISTPVVLRLVESWISSRAGASINSAARLDKLETEIIAERLKTDKVQSELYDITVKYEVLLVHFEMLQKELRACKGKDKDEHPVAPAVSK